MTILPVFFTSWVKESEMASQSFTIGLLLILLAIGYQYREEIKAVVAKSLKGLDTKSPEVNHKEKRKTSESSTSQEADPGPDKEGFPDPEYYNPPFDSDNPPEPMFSKSGTRLITLNELAAHGHDGPLKPLWLAIMGRVYDVEKGAEHYYGPNGGYKFFTGRDGSRAFVTGHFDEEGLIDDIEGISVPQVGEIDDWVKFYDTDYTFAGKLIARYYNKDGNPTKDWYKYQKALSEKDRLKAEQQALQKSFPGCNSHWTEAEGGKVFCTDKSGGVQRDWVGYPRRFFVPGTKTWRCACVHGDDLSSPQVKYYPGCDSSSFECKVDPKQLAKLKETGG